MERIKLVLVGVGGYGNVYLNMLENNVPRDLFELEAVVDPYAEKAEGYSRLAEAGVPIFDNLEDFYISGRHAHLAIISTPIYLHRQQCETCMKHGSHVLCEKPITALLQEALLIQQAQQQYGRKLGVGFQWSFSTPILELKKDILSGALGRPLRFRTFVSWPRYDDYYTSGGWKGRIKDASGGWVLDSVATNATAHYLHNLLFLSGQSMYSSALPSEASALLMRAKPIESYDTCCLKGRFENGCEFLYLATHSGEVNYNPVFFLEFENAVVKIEDPDNNGDIIATFHNGAVKNYGDPQSMAHKAEKITRMIGAVAEGEEIPCTIETVIPHLTICNAMAEQVPVAEFPMEQRYRTVDPSGDFVRNLSDDMLQCYNRFEMPQGFSAEAQPTELRLDSYSKFQQIKKI